MTLNSWQRKAQERYPLGAFQSGNGSWLAGRVMGGLTPLPIILEHLAYERQECDNCSGTGGHRSDLGVTYATCPTCHGTGTSPDYRKAQEWEERLGLEDG